MGINMKIVTVLFTAVIICLCVSSFLIGRGAGIRYAVENVELWTVTRYNPDCPEDSAWNGYDQQVFMDLDGVTYTSGMYQY